jgi:C-terminal processing protease CtpA/Prc
MFDFLWPLLQPAADGTRRLTLDRDGRTATVAVNGVSLAQRLAALRARGHPAPDHTWRLTLDGATAVMTLPTFAYFDGKFDGKAWLRDAFDRINRASVTRLVLDLRANEGGNDGLGEEVLSYVIKAPFVVEPGRPLGAYERVPYVLARFLETWDYDFFDRTGRVEKLGERTYLLKYRMEQERRIVPQAAAFSGRVVALVGPRNSSATSILARRLQQTRAALLVGQPTGGNRRGLNGGEIAWIRLPGSGVTVDIPLVAQNPAREEPDASTLPDVAVPRTFAHLKAGVDRELAAALQALASP